jgi:proteasome lid subunit RPN8/RPN11
MLYGLVSKASRLLNRLQRSLWHTRLPEVAPEPLAAPPRAYRRLDRVVLTDEVSRTLFSEFQNHRRTARGDEEIGWVLLGVREARHALVLATLPAGAQRSAGVAHVQFNSSAQALASRIVRQSDKRLAMLGVVHTHPGSLRHPSQGDYQGDSIWVGQLRGREGIFGIGTADADPTRGTLVAHQPEEHRQALGDLCFSWYALGEGDGRYRPLAVQLTIGPDLAKSLHPVWAIVESQALALDRLSRQQANVTFQTVKGKTGAALAINVRLADPDTGLRLVLEKDTAQYYLLRQDHLIEVDPHEKDVERAVYLILAELAGQK